jgi:branched-subunit amino acid ABC-type transport system permease component
MARRVMRLMAEPIAATTAEQELVLAALGMSAALAHTTRIVVKERMLPETAQERMAQSVAGRHHAEVSTIRLTVTMSLVALGRPQSH